MGPLRHRRLQRLVDPWLDNETTSTETLAVATHVARCGACLALIEITVLLKRALARRPDEHR